MFDEYAKKLIEKIPRLPELDIDECRRTLSKAYFYIVLSKLDLLNENISREKLSQIKTYLRKLADTLESVAIFDKGNGIDVSDDVINACAFVAAESIALLLALSETSNNNSNDRDDALLNRENYLLIESALLYMVGGYDINALSIIQNVNIPNVHALSDTEKFRYSVFLIDRLCSLCKGDINFSLDSGKHMHNEDTEYMKFNYNFLLDEIRTGFYYKISYSVNSYIKWLAGYESEGLYTAIDELTKVCKLPTESGYKGYTGFADIYHLSSLILSAISRTSKRSLVHTVPLPQSDNQLVIENFRRYLKHRASGDKLQKGRPFLWPSAIEYISDCLPGPNKDAVISMPTGSGKSFVAELAVAHALCNGWVLYLTPTNSLAHQVRRDLKTALRPFEQVKVCAFVGGEEYTTLFGEQLEQCSTNYVAVMTPEKCALALRLYPERFLTCSLCVFDECHLLNDQKRGITVDILFAQLFNAAPQMKFLLMSAMVSNPDELASWLENNRGEVARSKAIKWRPSRTMRGLLVIESDGYAINYGNAKSALMDLPPKRKNVGFNVPLALIAGLSGPWTFDGEKDYSSALLPISFPAKVTRNNFGKYYFNTDGWKNTSARIVSEMFASYGIPVINFILTSRHHAFSSAEKVNSKLPNCPKDEGDIPKIVKAWLAIADQELGVETAVRNLLLKGVSVHTSAMLQCEQAASEWMFVNQKTTLMFATGTLAQGLNLPATAVVISGTSMGDPRDIDLNYGITRVNSLILNGFGRAGRPGFSNQGIGILVSDDPYKANISDSLDPELALRNYSVMGEPDAAINVHSPVEEFIDSIIINGIVEQNVLKNELALTTLLAEVDSEKNNSGEILSRTFAAYHKREQLTSQLIEKIHIKIKELKNNFLIQNNVPEWISTAAMKAGVDIYHAWNMWIAYNKVGIIDPDNGGEYTVLDWVDTFFNVMTLLPPNSIMSYLPGEEVATETVLTKMRDLIISRKDIYSNSWDAPEGWKEMWQQLKDNVLLYMNGRSYKILAQVYLNQEDEEISNNRCKGSNPIPAIFKFLHVVVGQLAIDAGCFLAINEFGVYRKTNLDLLPESLQALSLCIKNGCNSVDTLAWFRFGIRQRVCAHALQRKYPIPNSVENDLERSAWVRNTKRLWLQENNDPDTNHILDCAKTIILGGYEH